MASDDVRRALARAEIVHGSGKIWEPLWDVVYRYVAPSRANLFQKQQTPSDVQEDVFDSTAIEAAEGLVNNVMTGMFPHWRNWFSFAPGPAVRRQKERDRLRTQLDEIRDFVLKALSTWGFYDAMAPVLLDRCVGGTGYLEAHEDGGSIRFSCAGLSDTRSVDDTHGRPLSVCSIRGYPADAIRARWRDKLPRDFSPQTDPTYPAIEVVFLDERDVDGMWKQWTILKTTATLLEYRTGPHPRFYPTRWSRVPNWPYGRGPALLALSDVRALNKLKELTLLNAAKAVAGVYTAVDDGVLNPYTVSFAAGAVIPVATNDPNNPTLRPLETVARFDISQWSLESLSASIKTHFMADQFGPLERTPRSATEIAERSAIMARRVGATLLKLREELVEPVLQRVLDFGTDQGLIPAIDLSGPEVSVIYEGELATAQRALDAQNITEFTMAAVQFGQVDPLAGFVVDMPAALRRYAELRGIPDALLRTEEEAEALASEAAQAGQGEQAGGEVAGTPQPGQVPV